MNDRMTAAEAQAMVEEVLEYERTGSPIEEAKPGGLAESDFGDAYGAFMTIRAAYRPNFDRLYTAVNKLVKSNPGNSMAKILFKEVRELQTAMAKLEGDFADLKKRRIEDEEPQGEPLEEDANRAIFDAIGRVESDLTDMKQAINQGKLEDASLIAANVVSHAGDVALYFWIVAKKQGFTGNPLKRFESYMSRFRVMKPATH